MVTKGRKNWHQFHKLDRKAGTQSFFDYVSNMWVVEIEDAKTGKILHHIECLTINDAKKGTRGLLKSIIDRKQEAQ